jgi:hypothetical protein
MDPPHIEGRAVEMREQVEVGSPTVLDPGLVGNGSPNLRLLLPWVPDEAAEATGGRGWPDGPVPWAGNHRRLALVSVIELELARPSAMIVMQQILDAWRSAERQLEATFEGSPERRQIQAQIATLRALYQGLFAQVRQRPAEGAPF